ncbi:MAG TPA: acyl-CoA thioesterase, partial [Halieaceae bacterium]|nr:acyl-CoA thioesterase [Halieaceae bacterium]
MSWDHASPYIHQVTVLPEHIDALEHTNNTQYVTWCNETAWAHTTALGLGANEYQDLN